MRISDVGERTAAFTMPLSGWLQSPQGLVSIGPLTMPADAAVACAIQTELPARTAFSTSELSLRLLAPVRTTGTLTARGRLIELRRHVGLGEVSVYDEEERLIAHGSSLCFVSPGIGPSPAGQAPPPDADVHGDDGWPDPYAQPPLGEVLPDELWERMSGLEILRAQLQGELPLPPIHHLTGLDITAASVGEATFAMPASEWLCAPARGRVQGGAVALLAEAALSGAALTVTPAGTALAPIDLKVNYLRPLPADGRRAVADGRVVQRGRRMAVATSEVRDADGRPVAIATGSALLLPGRPASLVTRSRS
jgi:uncharacterized protein (TIGR00369 family)